MTSGSETQARGSWTQRVRLGPQPVLLSAFAALVIALLGAFAYVVVQSQSQSRTQAEERFGAEADIASQLTSSLFSTSAAAAQASAARTFGGTVISSRDVNDLPRASGALYRVILDQGGAVIAASSDASAGIGSRLLASQPHVVAALGGKAALSDLLPAPQGKGERILEWAIPFSTPSGRRVEVQGLKSTPIFSFLNGYLGKTRLDGNGAAFVLDSNRRILAATTATAKPGQFPKATELVTGLAAGPNGSYDYAGASRYFASAPVEGTSWRVVLGVEKSRLYPALAGSNGWFLYVILGAFAVAAAASLAFFRRTLRTGAQLSTSNAELLKLNSTLEHRVAERTAELEARAKELARSNDELEQFSSVASHDLQEPLRKIRMFGDRLRERLGDSLSEEAGADLGRMSNAAERMQRLINDLLDFSRVTHRGREFEPVDLGQITHDVVADLEARVVELDASIDVGDLPVIDADETQMRQLIQNLVGNALKFHREGQSPNVRISSEILSEHHPRFPAESAAVARCVLTVRDNGIGFDEKHAERVFTAFERLHGRSDYEGTGIGLSIARKIVWRHGGHITASGIPDEGATFTVTLPLSQSNGNHGGSKQ